jgi:hypothetical protein
MASQPQPNLFSLDQQRLAVPRSVANLIILILGVLLVRRFVQVHFDLQISTLEAIGLPAAVAVGGLFFKYLPKEAREWIASSVTFILSSRVTTKVSILFLTLAIFLALLMTTITVSWVGPTDVSIFKNGLRLTPVIADNQRTFTIFTPCFRPAKITIKSYTTSVYPLPLKQSRVLIPFYVTASDIPELRDVENYLDLALLQQTPARYIKEATSRLAHLKQANTGISADALERLEDIGNILNQGLVEAGQTDIKGHLVEVYREKYPYDAWVKPLEAVVAYADNKYEEAITSLNSFDSPGARCPRLSTIRFLKATAYLRLANQHRVIELSNKAAVSDLATAGREYDAIITDMLRSDDQEYVSTIRPAAYIFRGITGFYQRDFESARRDFETVLRLDDADSVLKGRAENGSDT